MLDRQLQGALVKVKGAQQMIGQHVIGFGLQQSLQFVTGFFTPAFALVYESQQQALVDVGITQEEATLGAELVSLRGDSAAPCASLIGTICLLRHWFILLLAENFQ
jgi:hypothetical protein